MAQRVDPILTQEHCAACKKCLELNAQQQEILRLVKDIFPALSEFQTEADRFKYVAETLLARAFPQQA